MPERGHGLGFRLLERRCFKRAPLVIEAVELGGNAGGFRGVLLQQQPHAEIGAADAAAGIDARPEQKAEMPGLGRAGEARYVHQRGRAHVLAPSQRDQPLGDEGAVEAGQRHDVGDGAERDQMQQREQIGLGARTGPEIAPAQLARDRDQRDKHQPDRRQLAEAGQIVGAVGIDDGRRLRQFLVGLMMVDDDGVEAELGRLRQRLEAGGAAIDRHQKLDAFVGKRADRLHVRPIALEDAVGDMHDRIETAIAQIAAQQCRRRRAVDIVVAEDRDRLAARDRVANA